MIRGLYRMHDRLLGPAIRVHARTRDAGPVMHPAVYVAVGGQPAIAELPTRDEYLVSHPSEAADPFELP